MTQKLWQKKLKLNYSKDIFDIVQFGSSITDEKPNDVDIAVIFSKIPIKEQLNQSQEIKKHLQTESELPVHIHAFDLYSFFLPSNFAKENILFYGKSIISKEYFAIKFGLNPSMQIFYSLRELKKKGKIRFNYMLNGKQGKYGLLRQYGGKIIAPGLIEISPEHEKIFVDTINLLTNKFTIKKTYTYI